MPPAGTPDQRLPIAHLGAIVAVASLLGGFFYTGYYASDDVAYMAGVRMLAGEADVWSYGAERLAVTGYGAIAYLLAGRSPTAVFASFVAWHPLLALATFLAGRWGFDSTRAALLAAWLVTFCPIIYFYAGCILPDNAQAFWSCLSLAVLLALLRGRAWATATPQRRLIACFLVGLLAGMSYMAKESSIVIAAALAVGVAWASPRLLSLETAAGLLAMGLGALMVFGVELLVLHATFDRWMLRVALGSRMSLDGRAEDLARQGIWPWERFAALVRILEGKVGRLWVPVAVGPLLAPLARLGFGDDARARRSTLGFSIFFFVFLVVYQTVGTVTFSTYLPPIMQARYYAIAVAPGALLLAAGLMAVVERTRPAAFAFVLGAVLFLGGRQAVRLAPSAGTMYWTHLSRAYRVASVDARLLHPGEPLVLDPVIFGRMFPLLPAGASAADGPLPEPPFLVMRWSPASGEGPSLPAALDRRCPVGRHIYRPWAGRLDELRAAWGYTETLRVDGKAAIVLERVDPAATCPPVSGSRPPPG